VVMRFVLKDVLLKGIDRYELASRVNRMTLIYQKYLYEIKNNHDLLSRTRNLMVGFVVHLNIIGFNRVGFQEEKANTNWNVEVRHSQSSEWAQPPLLAAVKDRFETDLSYFSIYV
jgi:hypothetical protein